MVGSGWQHRTAQIQTARPLQPQNNAGTTGAPERGSLLGRSVEPIASKNKWDTVALLLARKPLKTNKGDTQKVGHSFDHAKSVVMPKERRQPRDLSHFAPATRYVRHIAPHAAPRDVKTLGIICGSIHGV